jgi:hypothetical protein
MARHNKQKHSIPLQSPPLSDPAVLNGAGSKPPLLPREVFKSLFEKALDLAKSKLHTTGRIGATALFVYGGAPEGSLNENATHVSLSYKDEFHKEAVRRKIHEKVDAEGASAVVLLVPAHPGRERAFLISGTMPGLTAGASVTYTFDKATKTFSFSELVWRDEPIRVFFLEGLFSAGNTLGHQCIP